MLLLKFTIKFKSYISSYHDGSTNLMIRTTPLTEVQLKGGVQK